MDTTTKISAISLAAGMYLPASERTVKAVYRGGAGRAIVVTVTKDGEEIQGNWNALTLIGVATASIPETHYQHPNRRTASS